MRAICLLAILALAAPAGAQPATAPAAPESQPAAPAAPQSQPAASAEGTVTAAPAPAGVPGDSATLPGALVVAAEVGGIFPQPFAELGSHVAFGLELGYRMPFLAQRLEAFLGVGYSPPGRSFTVTRAEGAYEGTVSQQELTFSLGPRLRLMPRSSRWNVDVAVGGRLFLLKSTSSGSRDGTDFLQFREQSTKAGFFFAVGGEYGLGPGAVFLDVDLGWSGLDHTITGDVSTGNITTTVGYRLFLL